MHIILVCREYVGSARSGGIGSYMHDIACAYIKKGHKVTVITASDNTKKQYETTSENGICIKSLSGGDFLVSSVEGYSKIKKLRCIYRFHSYRKKLKRVISSIPDADIVEVADFGAESLYLHNLNIPIIVRLHTPQSLEISTLSTVKPKWWQIHRIVPIRAERRIFSNARYITGCSQAIINWVSEHFNISQAKKAVIKNPVSVPHINIYEKQVYQVYNDKTIFYAGTISDTKGVGDLVEACAILRDKGLNIKLKLAGKGGSYQKNLQNEVKRYGWSWIKFMGKLSRNDVFKNYMNSDVCCFPSWWENMPMVVLESMALGAIVVSTTSGGTSEIITDGYNGFLCERKNANMLAETLHKALVLSDTEQKQLKERAKGTIQREFSLDKISTEMLDYFQEVINDFKQKRK